MGSSPSGTSATITPTPSSSAEVTSDPITSEAVASRTPTDTAMSATTMTSLCSCTASGLGGRRASAVSAAMPARRVRVPIAVTTPAPSPWTAKVPA